MHQEFPRADHRYSCRRCSFGSPDVWLAIVIFLQLFASAFVLPPSNILQIHTVRRALPLHKKNRDAIAFPDFVSNGALPVHAILIVTPSTGMKARHPRPHSWMRAGVRVHVDSIPLPCCAENRRLAYSVGFARHVITHRCGPRPSRGRARTHPARCSSRPQRVHLRRISPFGKIRHTLDSRFIALFSYRSARKIAGRNIVFRSGPTGSAPRGAAPLLRGAGEWAWSAGLGGWRESQVYARSALNSRRELPEHSVSRRNQQAYSVPDKSPCRPAPTSIDTPTHSAAKTL